MCSNVTRDGSHVHIIVTKNTHKTEHRIVFAMSGYFVLLEKKVGSFVIG
jgi:hypothetical protein